MTAYCQKNDISEDYFGKVRRLFVVSDSYDGLYSNDAITANIFLLGETGREIKNGVGGVIDSDLSFEINEARCKTTNELAALAFVKECFGDATIKRFCAVFIISDLTATMDDIKADTDKYTMFAGLIQPDPEGTDLQWHGVKFSTDITPLRNWQIKAKPYSIEGFGSISTLDLIDSIDSMWEDSNVASRQGYFKWEEGRNRSVYHYLLADLNKVLRKLANIFTSKISTAGLGTINFTFTRSALDGVFHPARWIQAKVKVEDYGGGFRFPRYVGVAGDSVIPVSGDRGVYPMDYFNTYDDDYNILYIDPDGSPSDDEIPFFSYNQIRRYTNLIEEGITLGLALNGRGAWDVAANYVINDVVNFEGLKYRAIVNNINHKPPDEAFWIVLHGSRFIDPLEETHIEWRWGKKSKTFFDLLTNIALNFGLFLKIGFTDSETINIEWIPRGGLKRNKAYYRSAVSAKINMSPYAQSQDSTKLTGKSFFYCDEGKKYVDEGCTPKESYNAQATENKIQDNNLPLTISPTIARLIPNCCNPKPEDDCATFEGDISQASIPYNSYFSDNSGNLEHKEYGTSRGFHSGIYLKVNDYAGHATWEESNLTPTTWWTPAAALTVVKNGSQITYNSMTDYLQALNSDQLEASKLEYELEIPYFFGFAANADGTGLDWRLCDVGNYLTIDNIDYIIISAKWSLKEDVIKVTLRLQNADYFDISNSVSGSGALIAQAVTPPPPSVNYKLAVYQEAKTAYSDIAAGQLVSLRSDGLFEPSLPTDDHFCRVYGIAVTSAAAGEMFVIQTKDDYTIPDGAMTFVTQGMMLYLRMDELGAQLITQYPLTDLTTQENLFVYVGIVNSANTIKINDNFQLQYIFR